MRRSTMSIRRSDWAGNDGDQCYLILRIVLIHLTGSTILTEQRFSAMMTETPLLNLAMSSVVASKKTRKKQSAFEKLWAKAARLRAQNEKFAADLDAIVARMETDIKPREAELARLQIPLLQKLLTLGQRKSMTNWERATLDDWIKELIETIQTFNLVNTELLDDVARYDAFRMGITLQDDTIPPHQEFGEMMKQADEERAAAIKRQQEQHEEHLQEHREAMMAHALREVEQQLDSILGPEPSPPANMATQDLWPDELELEQQRLCDEYRAKREQLKEEMMAEKTKEIEMLLDLDDTDLEDDDDFDFDEFDFSAFEDVFGDHSHSSQQAEPEERTESSDQALSNQAFQQMFRATAGKLHPDREPDATIRLEKQKLMASLLKARKKGDVLTVMEMYEKYVGKHEGFSKADQKALLNSLKAMISELEESQEAIIYQSPMRGVAYHLFYSQSKKKVNAAFETRLKEIQAHEKFTATLTKNIRSLKTLKPQLEQRYDAMAFQEPTLEDFMDFMRKEGPFDTPF